MSTEKALKYLKNKVTPAEFERQVKALENKQIPFETPIMATGRVRPPNVIFKELEEAEEERRHQEILTAIAGKQTNKAEIELHKQEPFQFPIPSNELEEKVKKFTLDGVKIKAISMRLAISESTVKRIRKKLRLTKQKEQ